MASSAQWTWVWVNSGSWWWAGRPGVLQSMVSQRVGHDWVTELLNWTEMKALRARTSLHILTWACASMKKQLLYSSQIFGLHDLDFQPLSGHSFPGLPLSFLFLCWRWDQWMSQLCFLERILFKRELHPFWWLYFQEEKKRKMCF